VQSNEQIVPIINSLVNDARGTYQVNIPNTGQLIKGFPEDLVVECEAIVDGAGIRGLPQPALPRKVMVGAMIPRWQRAEQMVEALVSGDRDILLHYVLNDPRTRSLEQAERMLSEWLGHPKNADMAKLFPLGSARAKEPAASV
jgi:alpha-galactosidase